MCKCGDCTKIAMKKLNATNNRILRKHNYELTVQCASTSELFINIYIIILHNLLKNTASNNLLSLANHDSWRCIHSEMCPWWWSLMQYSFITDHVLILFNKIYLLHRSYFGGWIMLQCYSIVRPVRHLIRLVTGRYLGNLFIEACHYILLWFCVTGIKSKKWLYFDTTSLL